MHPELLNVLFTTTAQIVGIDPALLTALCKVESGHKVTAINYNDGKGHSYGICQVKYETAKQLGYTGTPLQLWYDPVTNILYAAKYLKWQMSRYQGDVNKAVIAYNAGSYSARKSKQYLNKVRYEYEHAKYTHKANRNAKGRSH